MFCLYLQNSLATIIIGWTIDEGNTAKLEANYCLCILIVTAKAKRSNENSFDEIISDGDSTAKPTMRQHTHTNFISVS